MKYQVLTADKTEDITLEAAQAALAEEYPEYKVEVHDDGQQFIAKLTHKTAADDEEEGGDDEEPAPSGKKPPFLDEKDDDADEGEEPKKKPADDDDGDDDDDDDDEGSKDDLGGPGDDAGVSDVVKALKALKELDHVLPKLKDQLKSLNGGDDLGADGGPGDHGLVPPPPPGGPGGPPGGPPGPPKGVGPTPGAPPGAAGPGGGGPSGGKAPFSPPPAPNVQHGLDMRKGPQVGPSTFGSVQDKFLNRPVANEDGSRSSLLEVTEEIAAMPRYANYYVAEVKHDLENDQWVAHLKSR